MKAEKGLPKMFERYNGKPTLMTRSSRIVQGEGYFEMDVSFLVARPPKHHHARLPSSWNWLHARNSFGLGLRKFARSCAVLSLVLPPSRLVTTVQPPSVVLPCPCWNLLYVGCDLEDQNPRLRHDRSAD